MGVVVPGPGDRRGPQPPGRPRGRRRAAARPRGGGTARRRGEPETPRAARARPLPPFAPPFGAGVGVAPAPSGFFDSHYNALVRVKREPRGGAVVFAVGRGEEVKTGGEGRARGQRSGGKPGPPGWNASRGTPDAVPSAPTSPPRRAAPAVLCRTRLGPRRSCPTVGWEGPFGAVEELPRTARERRVRRRRLPWAGGQRPPAEGVLHAVFTFFSEAES